MSKGRAIQVYDPQTGRTLVVYQHPTGQPPTPPNYPPAHYEDPYAVEPYAVRPYPVQRRRKRRRPRRPSRSVTSRALLAGGAFAAFIASWIPCAFDAPGGTLLCWGLLGAYLIYRAVRGV